MGWAARLNPQTREKLPPKARPAGLSLREFLFEESWEKMRKRIRERNAKRDRTVTITRVAAE